MAIQTAIVAGVFTHEAQVRRALDALKSAGFDYDQIGVASQRQAHADLLQELLALGVSQERANYYNQEYMAGRTIVSVRPDGREQEALTILRNNGGYDYDQRTASEQMPSAQPDVQSSANEYYQPRSLKLREEQLNVAKQNVQTGEVELRKDVITEQKTINVPVTHEEVYIERRVVNDGQVDATPIGEDETISVPVSEERVNVSKNTVVTGEVAIGKRAVEETQQVADTVKHEEVRVEQEGNAPLHGATSDIDPAVG